MNDALPQAFITGMGVYIPQGRMSAADIALASGLPPDVVANKLGILEKPVPGPQDQRNTPGHAILGASIITNGSLSEDVLVPVGGTKAPLHSDNTGDYRLQVRDPIGMRQRLAGKSINNFLTVIQQAVSRSQAQLDDIDYLALLHIKRSAHDQVPALLNLPAERCIYLNQYGHIGQVDQILSLILARDAGRLARGDLAVLVAAGVGYVWNALCLRWDWPFEYSNQIDNNTYLGGT